EAVRELRDHPPASKILIAAGSLTQTFGQYLRQTQSRFDQRFRGLLEVVEILLAHLESEHATTVNRDRLAALRVDVVVAAAHDLNDCPEKLRVGLEDVAAENRRAEQESRHLLEGLRDRLTVLEQTTPALAAAPARDAAALDSTTGLPLRAEAE